MTKFANKPKFIPDLCYNTHMIKKIANVLALGGAVVGSTLIASNIGLNFLGYVFFLLSSVSSVYLLLKMSDAPKSLVLQSVFFIGVNLFGLVRYFA